MNGRAQISRVLLVTPPDASREMFQLETARRGRYANYPPYGLAVLAARLRETGIDVAICNLHHEILRQCHEHAAPKEFDFDRIWQNRLDSDVEIFKPDFIGVTCMFTMTHTSFQRVCKHLAQTGIPIGIGGVHVSNDVERVLNEIPDAKIAFLRESDRSIQVFVRVVNGTLPISKLGQVVLNPDGTSISPKRYSFSKECVPTAEDIRAMPAFDLLEVPEYSLYGTIGSYYSLKPKGTLFSTVLSNRGCRAQCTFCSVRTFNGKGVRQRDVIAVVDELQFLAERFGVRHIMWLDDDLLKDEKRAIAMFNEMVRRNLPLTWDASNGVIASSCTEEVVHAMADSGCIGAHIGMESGNPTILRQIKKPGIVRNFLKAAENLRKYESIHSRVFLMLGFPGETMSMMQDTLNVALEMSLDWAHINVLQPLPNTPIYDSMVAQGLIQTSGQDEVRYSTGSYAKQTDTENGRRLENLSFREAFSFLSPNDIPTPEQITHVWFYMNYHINFHRLLGEERLGKLHQQAAYLRNLTDIVAPEHGFGLYFLAYLESRLSGRASPETLQRLNARLTESAYWKERFAAFGLSVEDAEKGKFSGSAVHEKQGQGAFAMAATLQ